MPLSERDRVGAGGAAVAAVGNVPGEACSQGGQGDLERRVGWELRREFPGQRESAVSAPDPAITSWTDTQGNRTQGLEQMSAHPRSLQHRAL